MVLDLKNKMKKEEKKEKQTKIKHTFAAPLNSLCSRNNCSFSIKSIILDPNECLKMVKRYKKNSNILITNKKFINEIIIVCKTGEQKDRSKNSNGK